MGSTPSRSPSHQVNPKREDLTEFLQISGTVRVSAPIAAAQRSVAQVIQSANPSTNASPTAPLEFDVVISFAGPDRAKAEELAERLRSAGVRVFYDSFYPEMLWGKDLAVFFADIFRRSAKFCVIFASREYNERMWTTHERQHATARALEERGGEYILPIKVENIEIPGISPTIGYISLADYSIADIASLLIKKLREVGSPKSDPFHA